MNKIITVGSGLVDFLVHSDNNFIKKIGVEKGGMTLVDMNTIDKIIKDIPNKPVIVPGGASCNTAVGIAQLGGKSIFIGKLGNDKSGTFFKNALIKRKVDPILFNSKLPTGKVLSIITPDAQRTMLTCLSAASEISSKDIQSKFFAGSNIVHVEGYLFFNPELVVSIFESAKSSGALISLDLSSFTVINEYFDIFNDLIPRYVDIIIANEDEAKTYSKYNDEKLALKYMAKNTTIAVVKMGSKGSYISYKGSISKIEPKLVEDVIDTTGAGDLWASGFLFGLTKKRSIQKCGNIASICGAEVCRVIGANIPNPAWKNINSSISSYLV